MRFSWLCNSRSKSRSQDRMAVSGWIQPVESRKCGVMTGLTADITVLHGLPGCDDLIQRLAGASEHVPWNLFPGNPAHMKQKPALFAPARRGGEAVAAGSGPPGFRAGFGERLIAGSRSRRPHNGTWCFAGFVPPGLQLLWRAPWLSFHVPACAQLRRSAG